MPVLKSPKQFPGSQHLPELAQLLLQRVFPPDELPMPGAVLGPRTPVPVPQSKSLLGAFRPWGKNLEKAYPSLFGPSQVPAVPESVGQMGEALKNLLAQLKRP